MAWAVATSGDEFAATRTVAPGVALSVGEFVGESVADGVSEAVAVCEGEGVNSGVEEAS